jgi:two-component system, sensor histidine kinase and response regulator
MNEMTTRAGESAGDAHLHAVLESAHEAFISMDEDGRIRAWNREAERTFGWSREAVVGELLRDMIIPPEYRQRHDAGLQRFLETGEGPLLGKRIEISALHRSGHEFPVELTVSALRHRGEWTFHAFVHDISDRYRLTEVQARLATLVEHSADAIISRTPDGRVTSWNPGAEELFGYSAEEMLGRTMDRLLPPHREGEVHRLIERVLAGEAVRAFETERVCKDGRMIDVSLTISPIRDDAGQVREISMIARDVSERRASERALAHAYDELERANDLKSRFVAVASHELRTPLTSIGGFASTLLDRWESIGEGEKRQFLTLIESQTARLTRIVRDLLTLSRIEAGKIPLEVEPVDVDAVAQRAVAELGMAEDTTFVVDGPALARADADHVLHMLVNYLANARTYGCAPYEIEIGGDGEEVVVAVCDAGEGVPAPFVPELFETFAQASPAAPGGHGSGLGLAIVAGLAEAVGGRAWYEPRDPRGSRFCVGLPRA